ncbi:MAG: hypothetical protein HY894_03700 [Deltaproteobacteria bacterium]|nr:hypothetical protein [Deltaproteobacteria bacterium]
MSNTVATAGSARPRRPVKFYLSADALFYGGDVLLGQRSVGAITSATPSSMTKSLTIPATTVPGYYNLIAHADATNTNAESNETNNAGASAAVSVGP